MTYQHSRPFAAGFDSECADCGDDIYEGDRIIMVDGEATHVSCYDHDECPSSATCD